MYKNPYIKIQPKTRRPYTEIYLVRHCNPDYSLEKKLGESKMPLSLLGLRQRKYLTKKLMTLKIDKIYTSEIVRAQETAFNFIKKTKKKALVSKDINEFDWLHWHKMKFFHMTEREREKKLKQHYYLDRELRKMQVAARKALSRIFETGKGKKIVLFSHGNFIKALLTAILNADVIGFLSLEIFQASISKIVIDKGGYVKISYINNVSHLPQAPTEDLFITLVD